MPPRLSLSFVQDRIAVESPVHSRHSARSRTRAAEGAGASSAPIPIAAVERDTGLTKDTLRIWERRYGFPRPRRDPHGERVYTSGDVEKLRLLKRLIDQGHRPGKLIGRAVPELELLVYPVTGERAAPGSARAAGSYVELIAQGRTDELHDRLAQAQLQMGLARFVVELMAPLTREVGEAWARGTIEVYEEHLYSEVVQRVLRSGIRAIPAGTGPRVLLTTLPQEAHGIGILMAEVLLALEGARCISLGVQTPVRDIVLAAESQDADIVALSFTPVVSPRQLVAGLGELRGRLAAKVELWAGGSAPGLLRRPPAGVRVLRNLADIGPALLAWRAR
jgi:methanogenic corrinoid protein MtbC1